MAKVDGVVSISATLDAGGQVSAGNAAAEDLRKELAIPLRCFILTLKPRAPRALPAWQKLTVSKSKVDSLVGTST
jgi:hypothetical protein